MFNEATENYKKENINIMIPWKKNLPLVSLDFLIIHYNFIIAIKKHKSSKFKSQSNYKLVLAFYFCILIVKSFRVIFHQTNTWSRKSTFNPEFSYIIYSSLLVLLTDT